MKEQIQLTNVKYLCLSPNTLWALVFHVGMNVCTISKVIGINEEKEICLPKMEYLSGHR